MFTWRIQKITLLFALATLPIASVASVCKKALKEETLPAESQLSKDAKEVTELQKLKVGKREALKAYAAPAKATMLGKANVIADYAMLTLLGTRALQGFADNPSTIIPAILLAPPVLFCADFLSQVVHKCLDSYISESNPIFGDAVRRFRQHHEVPYNLESVSYLDNADTFGKVSAPFLAASLFVNWSPEYASSVWLFLLSMMNATECHKQAHLNEPNGFFKALQKLRLSIGHREHMAHHTPPYDGEFAIFNGWSNPLSRKTRLWQRLDLLWWKIMKKMPHNWIQDPRSIPPSVIEELSQGIKDIPESLWEYEPVNGKRIPEELAPLIKSRKEKWRKDYVDKRRVIFQEKALDDQAKAESDWILEQQEYPWIYGERTHPLFKESDYE